MKDPARVGRCQVYARFLREKEPGFFCPHARVTRAIGWSWILRGGVEDEAGGFGGMLVVMDEGLVKRAVALRFDDGQDRVAQQGEVHRPAGLAPRAAILSPSRGVLAPVVLVLHRPVAANELSQPGVIDVALAQGGDEVPGLALEVAALVLATPIAGAGDQLPRPGEERGGQIETTDAQFAVFDATMVALQLRGPVRRTPVELFAGDPVEGRLVVLEGEQGVAARGDDDQRRFFWPCRASPLTTALGSTSATSRRSFWATGISQSSFLPL